MKRDLIVPYCSKTLSNICECVDEGYGNQEKLGSRKSHSVISVPGVHGLGVLENPEGLERETEFIKIWSVVLFLVNLL